jgi:hypothetical protein
MSEYEGMIGIREANPNAVCHDVLSMCMVRPARTPSIPHIKLDWFLLLLSEIFFWQSVG